MGAGVTRRSGGHCVVLALVALLAGGVAASGGGLGTDAHADAACDKYADPTNGNDANSGATPQQALQSPIALLNALAPGQEGCLTDGATFTLGGGDAITAAGGTPGLPITLRPTTPGARVTISAATGFEFQTAGHDIVFRDINFRRPTGGGGSLLQINGDRTTLDGVDLTYPYNICLDVGGDPRHGDTDPTEDFVLRNSRIHDCGSSYGPPHIPNDSGVHGIYAEFLRDGTDAGATSDSYSAVIEDNLIYANHNRGIQLYPDADDTLIRRNVFYGNGANVNIGSDTPTIASERNTFVDNIISESTLDGLAAGGFVGDTNEVLGNLVGVENPANHVDGNCINNTAHPTSLYAGPGFTHVNNIENQSPGFANPGAGDFTLASNSPCLGKGPASIQPPVPANPTPVFARTWGTTGGGSGLFDSPESIDTNADGSRVYVADTSNHRIQEFDPRGNFVRGWGSFGTGAGLFNRPVDLAVADNGDVYVADLNNNRVQQFSASGVFIRQWGSAGVGNSQFNQPHGVEVSGNDVFVADLGNDRVQRFDRSGNFVQSIGGTGSGAGQLDGPGGVATDSTGRIYVADLFNHRIQYFNFTGGDEGAWGTQGAGTGQFGLPVDVAVGPDDTVYVVDYSNHRVQEFARPTGAGAPAQMASWGTQGSAAGQFLNPESIAVAGHQHYVADGGNDRIQVFTTPGPQTGIGGSVTEQGTGAPVDGAAVAVLRTDDFTMAAGAIADAAGDYSVAVPPGSYYLYVVDPSGAHTAGFHGAPATVTVTSGAMTDVDPQMVSLRGVIAGTVTEAGSGTPVGGAWVIGINATTGATQRGAVADGAGQYSIAGLAVGSYRPVFVDPTGAHGSRYFPNSVDFLGATSLAVTAGASTAANVALPTQSTTPGAQTLSGTVREAGTNAALGGVFVVALRASDFATAGGAVTNGSGEYSLNVAAGDYKLAFVDSAGGHNMEWHNNQPNTGLATATSVTAPAVTDAALDANTGSMAGTITDDPSGDPLVGAWVVAIGPTGAIAGGAVTAPDGTYSIAGLAPGTYRATIVDPNGGRAQEYHNNSPDYAGATPINITAAGTATINAALALP